MPAASERLRRLATVVETALVDPRDSVGMRSTSEVARMFHAGARFPPDRDEVVANGDQSWRPKEARPPKGRPQKRHVGERTDERMWKSTATRLFRSPSVHRSCVYFFRQTFRN
jgi:hypothetical protein